MQQLPAVPACQQVSSCGKPVPSFGIPVPLVLQLQQLRAELDARSVKCSDGLQTVPFVWEINRLRRSLSWMVQRWVALIGKLPSATSVFPIPEELESPTADRTDAGQSVEMRNLREAPTSKVRDVASGAGREAETAPARTLTHRRNYSGSVAGQFTTAFQVEGTPPDVQRQIQYSAPHLTAGPAMSEGQATMDRAGPADAPVIPMGLVARYVSMYEDASRPSAPSRPTSPKSSAQLSGAKSWNAKDWVESRRRSLAGNAWFRCIAVPLPAKNGASNAASISPRAWCRGKRARTVDSKL